MSRLGNVLDLTTALIIFKKCMAEEFARCSESIIRLVFIVCLSNCGLATFQVTNR